MKGVHISLAAEELFRLGPLPVTNSLLTSWVIVALLVWGMVRLGRGLTLVPNSGQLVVELPFQMIYSVCLSVAGSERAKVFFPYIATFFIYILLSNWSGLVPGVGTLVVGGSARAAQASEDFSLENEAAVEPTRAAVETADHDDGAGEGRSGGRVPLLRAPSADLNMTVGIALVSVAAIQYQGLRSLGAGYLGRFFSAKPLHAFIGGLELISELSKIISFSFRLFGNIFAGEVLLVVIAFLIPALAPIPLYGLELFVGFIQALVFAMLSLVFMNIATIHTED